MTLTRLSRNQMLALIAGLLGFLALFVATPYRGNSVTMNVKELGLLVEKTTDHVFVEDLADWVIKGRADYRLIDVRSAKEFDEYHIPTAENIPVGSLFDGALTRNEKIILYSEGGIHAAQAWFLLRAQGFATTYILKDGLAEWKDRILFPSLADNASPEEKAAFEKRKTVSAFFGGVPQTGSTDAKAAPQMVMPKLEAPAGTAAKGTAPKKKKEGC
jgi:rhodanese-related sulfurtransferase